MEDKAGGEGAAGKVCGKEVGDGRKRHSILCFVRPSLRGN